MDVFVSHDFDDQAKRRDIEDALGKEGAPGKEAIKVWQTEQIFAGQSLRDKLAEAIESCAVCVFISTKQSRESGWCQAEIGAFWGAKKPVIVYCPGEKPADSEIPEQFRGIKWANSIRDVVSAVKQHLVEAAKQAGTASDALQSKRQEARAIYGLAIDSFMDALNFQFGTDYRGSTAPGDSGGAGATVRSVYAFGERVEYRTGKSGPDAALELRVLVRRIADFRRSREKEARDTRLRQFREVQRSAQFIAYYLGKIHVGAETLDGPWGVAQDQIEALWQQRIKELSCFDARELEGVRRFVEDHAAYNVVYAEASAEVDSLLSPRGLTLEELIELTRVELQKSLTATAETR